MRSIKWCHPMTYLMPCFQGTPLFDAKYFTNGYRYALSFYRMQIENRTQAFKWYHFQWSWVTSNQHFTSNFRAHSRDHIFCSLLPVRWRIKYKLCCIMHSVHTGRCPAYLKNTVQLAAARQSRSDLRRPIYFRGSRPSSVSVRSHTLVRPHCPHISSTFLVLTVSESF